MIKYLVYLGGENVPYLLLANSKEELKIELEARGEKVSSIIEKY